MQGPVVKEECGGLVICILAVAGHEGRQGQGLIEVKNDQLYRAVLPILGVRMG